jgi:hypothetical protein
MLHVSLIDIYCFVVLLTHKKPVFQSLAIHRTMLDSLATGVVPPGSDATLRALAMEHAVPYRSVSHMLHLYIHVFTGYSTQILSQWYSAIKL